MRLLETLSKRLKKKEIKMLSKAILKQLSIVLQLKIARIVRPPKAKTHSILYCRTLSGRRSVPT